MSKKLSLPLLIISALLIASCGGNKQNTDGTAKPSIEESKKNYQSLIDSIEKKMQATRDMPIDHGTAMFAMKCYDEYASYFPKEDKSPEYLFKAGEIANSMRFPEPAINYLSRLVTNYPSYKNIPYAIFMKGMIYDDQLKDTANARKMYQEVINRFPNTQMAEDSKSSIKNLGKSVEDLVKEFEKNQPNTSAKK